MIVDNEGNTELYSPEGHCNFQLAKNPNRGPNPVIVYANNRIILCEGGESCWEYNLKDDSWLDFVQAPFKADSQPGVVYDGKLYTIDTSQAYALDIESKIWSNWPMPPNGFGNDHWMVGWRDSIILIGGNQNRRGVQTFNITSQAWTVQNSTYVPMDFDWTSCLMIDEGEVLLAAGSESALSYKSVAKYIPEVDFWIKLEDSELNHDGSRLVKLGKRVFAIDGRTIHTVEEFIVADNSWSLVEKGLLNDYDGKHSVVALPASLFAHLPTGCVGVK